MTLTLIQATSTDAQTALACNSNALCLLACAVPKQVAAREKPPASAAVTTTKGPAPGTAHVHLIGEITGAVGLGPGPLYCTWQLVYDTRLWSITGGLDKVRGDAVIVWARVGWQSDVDSRAVCKPAAAAVGWPWRPRRVTA